MRRTNFTVSPTPLLAGLIAFGGLFRAAPEAQSTGYGTAVTRPLTAVLAESLALARNPMLSEKSLNIDKSREQVRDIEMGAILPKFEVQTGMGPAPGLRDVPDNSVRTSDGATVLNTQKEFNFSEWGPFFGIEATVAQPLNVARYRAGRAAATHQVRVSEAEFKNQQLDVSEEAQTLYYQRLFAITLRSILEGARKDLDKAQKALSKSLDDGNGKASQTDLLQMKAGRYSLDQGWNEAVLGVSRSALALRFSLGLPDSADPVLADTVLSLRPENVPPLDSLKRIALRIHPDLQRLQNGLDARKELLKVAQGEIGPDIFLFGSFQYTKAWSSDRQSGGNDPFARDPLNEITGVAGLGMKINLNFWERYQKYRKERLELRQLQRTEVYAARGVLLRVEDAYVRMLKARADVDESQKALRASEAWLKGVAIKYDLDPADGKDLIAPFKQSLTAQRDYYQAVMQYDVAVAAVLKSVGWTLSDYLGTLPKAIPASGEKE